MSDERSAAKPRDIKEGPPVRLGLHSTGSAGKMVAGAVVGGDEEVFAAVISGETAGAEEKAKAATGEGGGGGGGGGGGASICRVSVDEAAPGRRGDGGGRGGDEICCFSVPAVYLTFDCVRDQSSAKEAASATAGRRPAKERLYSAAKAIEGSLLSYSKTLWALILRLTKVLGRAGRIVLCFLRELWRVVLYFSSVLCRAVRKRVSFYRLHLMYFLSLSFLGALILWFLPKNPEKMPYQKTHMDFVDALFFATSALTVTGLTTLDMSVMRTADFVLLMFLAAIGGPVFTSVGPVLVRRYYFRLKLRQVAEESVMEEEGGIPSTKSMELEGNAQGRRDQLPPIYLLTDKQEKASGKGGLAGRDLPSAPLWGVSERAGTKRGREVDWSGGGGGGGGGGVASGGVRYVDPPPVVGEIDEERGSSFIEDRPQAFDRRCLQRADVGWGQKFNSVAPLRNGRTPRDHSLTWDVNFVSEQARKMVHDALTKRCEGGGGDKEWGRESKSRGVVGGRGRIGSSTSSATSATAAAAGATATAAAATAADDSKSMADMLALDEDEESGDESTEWHTLDYHKRRSNEYLALVELSKLVPLYCLFWTVFAWISFTIIIFSSSYCRRVVEENTDANLHFFSVFHAFAAFNNLGMSMIPANLVPLRKCTSVLVVVGTLMLVGQNLYAPAMRGLILLLYRFSKSKKHVYKYLLDHPRKCFTHLFPSTQTKWLVIAVVGITGLQSISFYVLDWNNKQYGDESSFHKITHGLFQSIAARNGGFQVLSIQMLNPAMTVLYTGFMYTAVYPVFLARQHSREPQEAYHDGEIGLPFVDWESQVVANSLKWQAVGLLGRDAFLAFISFFLICVVEADKVRRDSNFNFMYILFEVMSGFGNVGVSMGICKRQDLDDPESVCSELSPNYSLAGEFRTVSKVIMVFIMFLGRHRGLPHNIDAAVSIPKKALFRRQKTALPAELTDPMAFMRNLQAQLASMSLSVQLRERMNRKRTQEVERVAERRTSLGELVEEMRRENFRGIASAQQTGGNGGGGGGAGGGGGGGEVRTMDEQQDQNVSDLKVA